MQQRHHNRIQSADIHKVISISLSFSSFLLFYLILLLLFRNILSIPTNTSVLLYFVSILTSVYKTLCRKECSFFWPDVNYACVRFVRSHSFIFLVNDPDRNLLESVCRVLFLFCCLSWSLENFFFSDSSNSFMSVRDTYSNASERAVSRAKWKGDFLISRLSI